MALNVGDLVQLTDVQRLDNSTLLNVFYYQIAAAEADATLESVAEAYATDMLLISKQMQTASLVHTVLSLRNLTNGVDIHDETLNVAGTNAGEYLPSFVALAFRLVRATGLTRHGAKRIGGIPEAFVSGNVLINNLSGILPMYEAALAEDITWPGSGTDGVTATPVLIGRYPADSPNAGQLDLTKVNGIQSAQYIRVSSQTSRRLGRGV